MTTFIVGHQGQDGSLLREDLARDAINVVGIGRFVVDEYDSSGLLLNRRRRKSSYASLLAEYRPSAVFYFAAEHLSSEGGMRGCHSESDFRKFLVGPASDYLSLLESLQKASLDVPIFYASSCLIFEGNSAAQLREDSALAPLSFYGMSKSQGLWLGDKFRRDFGMRIFGGILFNHESHLRDKSFFTAKVIDAAIRVSRGEKVRLNLHSLSDSVDWGHAADFVRVFREIIGLPESENLLVATGEKNSTEEFVALVFAFFNLDWRDFVDVTPRVPEGQSRLGNADISRLSTLTTWNPDLRFSEFVHRLVTDTLARKRP